MTCKSVVPTASGAAICLGSTALSALWVAFPFCTFHFEKEKLVGGSSVGVRGRVRPLAIADRSPPPVRRFKVCNLTELPLLL